MSQAVAAQATPQADVQALPQPTSYKELVALFELNKEGPLHAQLYNNVSPVRLEPGMLEIHVPQGAAANFAARLTQCLTQWTGRRWMVSITAKQGGPTLAALDREAATERETKARAHPLMQAVFKAFPEAKVLSLKVKAVAASPLDEADKEGDELILPVENDD